MGSATDLAPSSNGRLVAFFNWAEFLERIGMSVNHGHQNICFAHHLPPITIPNFSERCAFKQQFIPPLMRARFFAFELGEAAGPACCLSGQTISQPK